MLKLYNYQITFAEIPDEVVLCLNISNCPIRCEGCHSSWLWRDNGIELTPQQLYDILDKNPGITCVCFMGGDSDYESLGELVEKVVYYDKYRCKLKIAFYSGRESIQDIVDDITDISWMQDLDFIKVGPYKKELGGLDNKNTNQRLYELSPFYSHSLAHKLVNNKIHRITGKDVTYKFWK